MSLKRLDLCSHLECCLVLLILHLNSSTHIDIGFPRGFTFHILTPLGLEFSILDTIDLF